MSLQEWNVLPKGRLFDSNVPKMFRAYTDIKYLHSLGGTYFEWLKYILLLVQFTAVQCSASCRCFAWIFTQGRAESHPLQEPHWLVASTSYNPTSTITLKCHSTISIYIELESLMPSLDTQAAVCIHVCPNIDVAVKKHHGCFTHVQVKWPLTCWISNVITS